MKRWNPPLSPGKTRSISRAIAAWSQLVSREASLQLSRVMGSSQDEVEFRVEIATGLREHLGQGELLVEKGRSGVEGVGAGLQLGAPPADAFGFLDHGDLESPGGPGSWPK